MNRGFTSSAVLDFLNWNQTHGNRKFYLMDTFHGLIDDQVNEEERALGRIETFKDIYVECFDEVKNNFLEYNDVVLVRGVIPFTLKQNPAKKVAFMHIDMNCAAPEIAAMRHFWPKMTPGGIVVLDDYAYEGYQPQKNAMDELGRELGFSVLSLPTGGGMIVKSPRRPRWVARPQAEMAGWGDLVPWPSYALPHPSLRATLPL